MHTKFNMYYVDGMVDSEVKIVWQCALRGFKKNIN
jgi:hypothetical protein